MIRRAIPIVLTTPLNAPKRKTFKGLSDSCTNLSTQAAVAASAPSSTGASGAAAIAAKAGIPVVSVTNAQGKVLPPAAGMHGLGWLGDSGDAVLAAAGVSGQGGVSGAVGGAAKGAAVGSAVPGVGTVAGAVIGAIAGGLIHTSKYADWLAADTPIIAQLRSLPAGFQGRQLSLQNLMIVYTAIIVTGNMYGYVNPNPGHSPSDMQNEFNWIMAWIKTLVQCANSNPVGDKLQVRMNVGNGVNFNLTFVNPGLNSSATFTQVVTIPAYLAWCTHNGAVDLQPSHCSGDAANPVNQVVLALMTDYVIAQVNPTAGVTPAPAATPPPSSGPAVVSAPSVKTPPIVTPAQQATVVVSTPATPTAPAAQTTVTNGSASTTVLPTLYWLANGQLGSGTAAPSGSIPLTQAQFNLMVQTPNAPAAQALYDSLMGLGSTPATSPTTQATPNVNVTVSAPAQSALPAIAPIASSGIPGWAYAAGAAALIYVISKK